MEVLNVLLLDVNSPNPLLLGDTLGVGGSLLTVWCCADSGFYGDSVSQSFLPGSLQAFSHFPEV